MRLLLQLRRVPQTSAQTPTADGWRRALAAALSVPAAQLSIVQTSAGGRVCIFDVLFGPRWRSPTHIVTSLVAHLATASSPLYDAQYVTAELDAAAGVLALASAQRDGPVYRLSMSTDGSLTRASASLPTIDNGSSSTTAEGREAGGSSLPVHSLLALVVIVVVIAGGWLRSRRAHSGAAHAHTVTFRIDRSAAAAAGNHQPLAAQQVDLRSVTSLPALRSTLLNAARETGSVGDDDTIDLIFYVDAASHEHTRFATKSQMPALMRATELVVTIASASRAPAATNGAAHGGARANGAGAAAMMPLLLLDEEEQGTWGS